MKIVITRLFTSSPLLSPDCPLRHALKLQWIHKSLTVVAQLPLYKLPKQHRAANSDAFLFHKFIFCDHQPFNLFKLLTVDYSYLLVLLLLFCLSLTWHHFK